jgi:hypothetical protein
VKNWLFENGERELLREEKESEERRGLFESGERQSIKY